MEEFADQTVLVTGGASGIGLATANRFAAAGARVFAGDLHDPRESSTAPHAAIEFVRCDVQQLDDVQRLVAEATADGHRLGVVVNNAGVGLVKQIPDVSEDDWNQVLNTNLRAAFFTAKFAIPIMRERGGGSIVNVASNAGLLPRAHDPVYSISKGALVSLTKSLALCHAADKIRVNCVCPGPVGNTGMMNADLAAADDRQEAIQEFLKASPLAQAEGRMIEPEEVAEAIFYLASESAAMVTGTSIGIDGGKSLGVPAKT